MLRKSASAFWTATRQLFINRQALAIITAIYAVLLATIYLFFTTKEATTTQVAITVALSLVAPSLFFLLQAAGASYVDGGRSSIPYWIRNSWKLLVISLPVIVIAILAVYFLNRLQQKFPSLTPVTDPNANLAVPAAQTQKPNVPAGWIALTSIRYLLIGVLAPLALIHLWISVNRLGLVQTLRKPLAILAQAFRARSVLIYMVGFIVFALIPYAVLFKTTAVGGAWLQIGLFSLRLFAVFCLTLLGWVITVGALSVAGEGLLETNRQA